MRSVVARHGGQGHRRTGARWRLARCEPTTTSRYEPWPRRVSRSSRKASRDDAERTQVHLSDRGNSSSCSVRLQVSGSNAANVEESSCLCERCSRPERIAALLIETARRRRRRRGGCDERRAGRGDRRGQQTRSPALSDATERMWRCSTRHEAQPRALALEVRSVAVLTGPQGERSADPGWPTDGLRT